MDYAEYVSRRPPSPPPLPPRDDPAVASASLSSTTSTLSAALSAISSLPPPHPVPAPSPTVATSSHLHRRALRAEYASLAALVAAAAPALRDRDRQEAVRIRLEDLLTRADPRALRVLHLALHKCTARLDRLADPARRATDARARMRAIESKHFLGPRRTATPVDSPGLRALHLERDGVATLVDHIDCTLHDQVRIHYLLTALAAKLAVLRSHLCALHRDDRPRDSDLDRAVSIHATAVTDHPPPQTPPIPLRPSSFTNDDYRASRTPFSRRPSRSVLRGPADAAFAAAVAAGDRPPSRSTSRTNVLHSQRSLPRRTESRLIPLVVKRALSYNASTGHAVTPTSTSNPNIGTVPHAGAGTADRLGDASWWAGDGTPHVGRSEPRLSMGESNRRTGWSRSELGRLRSEDDVEEECFPPVSPMSQCTTASADGSPGKKRVGSRVDSTFDQSVLVDLDSLCTEASSVLSRSGGVDAAAKPVRRGSVGRLGAELRRGKTFARLGFGRIRAPALVKKLWLEVNELYGIVLTHGPHLVEEKIVTRGSMLTGILGTWNSRKGKAGGLRTSFQVATVQEAMRKIDGVVMWQQRMIVTIRKDYLEQRKALRQADELISQAYIKSMGLMDGQRDRARR